METQRRLLAVTLTALAGSGCGGRTIQGSDGGGIASSNSGKGSSSGIPAGGNGEGGAGSVGSGFGQSGSGVGPGSLAPGAGLGSSDAGSGSGYDSMRGIDASAYCRPPAVDAGHLPFVVDTAFVPSGWMGDAPAYPAVPADPIQGTPASLATTARMTLLPTGYGTIGDACSPDGVGRSSAGAKGGCWKVTYVPFAELLEPTDPPGPTIAHGLGYGWAGAVWQYPRNNWGGQGGGYPIPPGATQVTFSARGKDGGELVVFFTGEGLGIPCSDYARSRNLGAGGSYGVSLASVWQNYTIDISDLDYSAAHVAPGQGPGGYYSGVIGAFGFTVANQTLPSADDGGACPAGLFCSASGGPSAPPNDTDPDGGPLEDPRVPGKLFPPLFSSTVTFYIDDIEFQ